MEPIPFDRLMICVPCQVASNSPECPCCGSHMSSLQTKIDELSELMDEYHQNVILAARLNRTIQEIYSQGYGIDLELNRKDIVKPS